MKKEYETKVLDINKKELEKKLKSIGAQKISEHKIRRWIFDWQDKDPEEIYEWIRLRDEDKGIILYYKKRYNSGKFRAKEIEVKVGDFDAMAEILSMMRFKRKFYQENYRTTYKLKNIEFMIDEWPKLKPHLEVEGKTKKDMEKGLELLGLKGKEVGDMSLVQIYKDELGIDLHKAPELRLERKKK